MPLKCAPNGSIVGHLALLIGQIATKAVISGYVMANGFEIKFPMLKRKKKNYDS